MSFFDAIGSAFSKAVDTISDIAAVAAPILFPGPTLALTAVNLVSGAIGEAVNGAAKQLTQECGMPKFLQDIIGKVVDEVLGKNRQPSDPACDAHCGGNRDVQDCKRDFIQDMLKGIFECVRDEVQGDKNCGGGKGKGGASSWLVALAKALGDVAGDKAAKMVELSQKLTDLNNDAKGLDPEKDKKAFQDNARESVSLQSELNGVSKEFQQFMETINSVVKGIGDGLTSVARKG